MRPTTPVSDRRFCILLVEDDRALGPLALGSLTHVGHRVTLAVSALEFYAYLGRRNKFDVVLLDLELGNDRSELVVARLHFEYVSLPPIVVFSALTIGELKRSVT